MRLLRKLLRITQVFITQIVRDDYRALPIGTRQLSELLPIHARIVTYPVVFYEGLHPCQVYVNPGSATSPPAPLTGYNDLRLLLSASLGETVDSALERHSNFNPSKTAVRDISARSLDELARRETELDVQVSELIASLGARAGFTINHPSNQVISQIARSVQSILDCEADSQPLPQEQLVNVVSPVERTVAAALDITEVTSQDWIIDGQVVPLELIANKHLQWLSRRPDVVKSGIEKYGARMTALGID